MFGGAGEGKRVWPVVRKQLIGIGCLELLLRSLHSLYFPSQQSPLCFCLSAQTLQLCML